MTDGRGRHGKHVKGSRHYRWANRLKSSHGYIKVRVGRTHPLADANGYAYEHLMVWVSAGNPKPGPNEVLHHVNHDQTDNRLENLRLMTTGQHAQEHNRTRPRDARGRFQ